jgi:hypothetical protein
VLIPSLQLTAIRDVVVENDKGARMKHTIIGLETNNLVRIPLAGKLTVKDQGKASVSVFFGNGLPFDGDSVVPALVRITEEVTRTLKELYILMDWKEAVEVFNGWKLG